MRLDSHSYRREEPDPSPAIFKLLVDDVAKACAKRFGIAGEELSDFRIELAEHILCNPGRMAAWQRTGYSRAWAYACACHYAIDFLRRWNRPGSKEVRLSELPKEACLDLLQIQPANLSEPQTTMIRKELRQKLVKALVKLSGKQQELLIGYHVLGKTIEELSNVQDRTQGATRQALAAAGKHLKSILERMGVDALEAGDYLAIIADSHSKTAAPPNFAVYCHISTVTTNYWLLAVDLKNDPLHFARFLRYSL